MKESFEEIVNILENRYKSYSPHHYDMFNLLAFGVEQNNATDNVFLVIDIQKEYFIEGFAEENSRTLVLRDEFRHRQSYNKNIY